MAISSPSNILQFHHFHVSAAKSRKNKKKKRASKLTALEMLEEKNKQKAVLKEKELEQRRLELEFQKRKYEDEAKERKERLNQELEERRLLFALLKDKFWYVFNQHHLYFDKFIHFLMYIVSWKYPYLPSTGVWKLIPTLQNFH